MDDKQFEAELAQLVADFRKPVTPSRDYSLQARRADAAFDPPDFDDAAVIHQAPVRVPAGITPPETRSWGWIVAVPVAAIVIPSIGYWLVPSKASVATAPPPVMANVAQPVRPEPSAASAPAASPVPVRTEMRVATVAEPMTGPAVPLPRARPKILR